MKKIIALVACLSLVASLAVGGSIAYLKDTKEVINVMTLGDVKIELNETDAAGNDFDPNQALYPAYYEDDEIDWESDKLVGEIEKFVSVKNTGSSNAFVRTWVAFEADTKDMIHIQWADGKDREPLYQADIAAEIKGETLVQKYDIYCVTYTNADTKDQLEPKATYQVLKRVAMDKEADNEYVESFGSSYDILVFSQAVQTTNLDQLGAEGALNEAFTDKHPWTSGAESTVPQGKDMKEAIEDVSDKNYARITLEENMTWVTEAGIGSSPMVAEGAALKNLIIDGNGKTLTATGAGVGALRAANGGTITFKNMTIVDQSTSYDENSWEYGYLEFAGNLVFENVAFKNAVMFENEANVKFVNCTFDSGKNNEYAAWVSDGKATFENCTFTGDRGLKMHEAYSSDVESVVVDGCTFLNLTKKPGIAIGDVNDTTEVTIKNSKFIGCQAGDQGKYIYESDTDVNTFKFTEKDNVIAAEAVEISTAAELRAFANDVNNNKNSYTNSYVMLTADIDLKNEKWEPIGQTGNNTATFNGIFDGNGHTISTLKVDSEAETGEHYSSGLFGWVETHSAGHGHIKNVTIKNATIHGHHNVGALVGYITEKNAVVENCHVVNAEITCTEANDKANGDKAGALIGNATNATTVKNCTATNSTVSAGRDAGQVIGAGREANVTGCSATNVTVTHNGGSTGANVRNEVIGRLL